jgi:uncharacterized protein YndB with AHSA1/START domain
MQSTTVPALVIRRTYSSPPERVYEAWTDPQLASQFLCPAGMTVSDIEMDVRAGGKFRIAMLMPDGEPYVAYGVYREVQRPSRLSMTWQWEENSPEEEHETLLTLEFNPHGSGTEFVLTHERLSSQESRENHERGWASVAEKLDGLDLPQGSIVAYAHVAASPERVFQALASKEILQWWVRPGVFDTREWSGEVRTGGRWRASGMAGGQPYAIEGEFLEVDAPRKLMHTWHPVGAPAAATTVTYLVEPVDGGTRVTLRHDGFPSEQASANTRVGWETSFARLAEVL